MKIEQARQLKVGDRVRCPPDRGHPGHTGTVTYIGGGECATHNGVYYKWVVVGDNGGRSATWPTNRLSKV